MAIAIAIAMAHPKLSSSSSSSSFSFSSSSSPFPLSPFCLSDSQTRRRRRRRRRRSPRISHLSTSFTAAPTLKDASASLSALFADAEPDDEMCFPESDSGSVTPTASYVGLLENVDKGIRKLEHIFSTVDEDTYSLDAHTDSLYEIQSKLDTLNIECSHMKALLHSRENSLNLALIEIEQLKNELGDAEQRISSLNIFKEKNGTRQVEEMSKFETSSHSSLQILDKYLVETQALKSTEEAIWNVQGSIMCTQQNSIIFRVIEVLQKDAALSFQVLELANEELNQEKVASDNLLSKWKETVQELKEKSLQVAELSQELADTKNFSEKVSEKLLRAEEKIQTLNQKLVSTEQSLEKEMRSLIGAREGLEKLDKALEDEESKAEDLFKEISALKVQLEEKEKRMQELTQELIKNKGLREIAKRNLDALHQSEKRAEQLVAQCDVLENQLRSRDALLLEIKEEASKSAESLRFASQIKKDLNDSRAREVELRQKIERHASYVEDLEQQLKENTRAVRAELALRQVEKSAKDLSTQVNILKKGIQSRDDVIKLMQERIDKNIHVLKSASADREAMKKMQMYITELESKLKQSVSLSTSEHARGLEMS